MQPTSLTLSKCSLELPEQWDYLPRAAFLRGRRPRSSAMKRPDGIPYAGEEQSRFAGSLDVLNLSPCLSPFYKVGSRHGA